MKEFRDQAMNELLTIGTRIVKTRSEPMDAHRNGAPGTVANLMLGPLDQVIGYFVIWDDMPAITVFIAPERVTRFPEASAPEPVPPPSVPPN